MAETVKGDAEGEVRGRIMVDQACGGEGEAGGIVIAADGEIGLGQAEMGVGVVGIELECLLIGRLGFAPLLEGAVGLPDAEVEIRVGASGLFHFF